MALLLNRRSALVAGAALALVGAPHAQASGLPAPKGRVILTIDGKIGVHNRETRADFDREMLEAMEASKIVTNNPWQNGEITFEGVKLATLMRAVRASGQQAKVLALNDFATAIPMEDFEKLGVILAWKADGAYLQPSDKGPLFVIYPFKDNPDLRHKTYYDRSAWQVRRITVG